MFLVKHDISLFKAFLLMTAKKRCLSAMKKGTIIVFRLGWKNCMVKNEKESMAFFESQFFNSNLGI